MTSDCGYVSTILWLQPWAERGASRQISDSFDPLQAALLLDDNILVSVTPKQLNNFFI